MEGINLTMGQKDISEKTLEAYNDVFADIVNVLLFKGKPLVKEDKLEEALLSHILKLTMANFTRKPVMSLNIGFKITEFA